MCTHSYIVNILAQIQFALTPSESTIIEVRSGLNMFLVGGTPTPALCHVKWLRDSMVNGTQSIKNIHEHFDGLQDGCQNTKVATSCLEPACFQGLCQFISKA